MRQINSIQDALQHVGAASASAIPSAPNQAYPLTFTFAAIAAGAVIACQPEKLPSNVAFVGESIVGSVWLTNAGGAGALAGTELPETSIPTDASNTLPPRTLITGNLKSNQYQYARNDLAWPLWIGTIRQPFILLHQLVFAPGSEIRFTGTNGTASTISGAVTIHGHYVAV